MTAIKIYEQFLDTQALANRTARSMVETHGVIFCKENTETLIAELQKPVEMTDLFTKCVKEYIQSL